MDDFSDLETIVTFSDTRHDRVRSCPRGCAPLSNLDDSLTPQRSAESQPSFAADLVWAAKALMRAPVLVLLSIVFAIPLRLTNATSLLSIPLVVVALGFVGTQRVWLARLNTRDAFETREIWTLTWAFIGRFLVLVVEVVVALVAPVTILAVVLFLHGAPVTLVIAANVVVGLVIDVLLTFVVPALALTTKSVHEAWRIGLAMIRQTWPRSAWYACAPGLCIVVAARLFEPQQLSTLATFAVAAVSAVIALWFKGAIVAFYMRQPQTVD
jgi:hypothetical protein